MSQNKFISSDLFTFKSGAQLENFTITYHSKGKLNKEQNNVVWICHALTANSDVFDWWSGLFTQNTPFSESEYFIICANIVGSHYGTSGPLSKNEATSAPYFHSFPEVTVNDFVNAHRLLKEYLGISEIAFLVGGSLGGMQVLDWSARFPSEVKNAVVLASNSHHSAWGKAFNEAQRLAIFADESFINSNENAGRKGLIAARSIALLSYRNYTSYSNNEKGNPEKTPQSYQQYQGEKLANRFNAISYVRLANAMDEFDIGYGFDTRETALKQIKANCLLIGISSDLLFPPSELKIVEKSIQKAKYVEIDSDFGHDGFLIETTKIKNEINTFIQWQKKLQLDFSATAV